MGQGHGNGQLHLHAAGIVTECLILRQSKLTEIVFISIRFPPAIGIGHHAPHVVGVQHLGVIGLVQHHANILFYVGKSAALVINTQNGHTAGIPLDGVHDQLDGGAFTGAVFTHQTHDAAGGQRQIKASQSETGVFLDQSF